MSENKKIQKRIVQIGDGLFAEIEQHPNTDDPQLWPETVTKMGDGILMLSDLHSEHYVPTPENRQKLLTRTRNAKAWCYMRQLNKTRS